MTVMLTINRRERKKARMHERKDEEAFIRAFTPSCFRASILYKTFYY